MVFDYYHRLSNRQKQIYRQSDRVESIGLPQAATTRGSIDALPDALERDDRIAVQRLCADIANGVTVQLGAPQVRVKVLAARPSNNWGELHGLYEPAEGRRRAQITVWMRTAKRRQVVAFRTFLRTLLHELCHHLDYEYFRFHDSFHTEGFYKRESSLFYALTEDEAEPEQYRLNL